MARITYDVPAAQGWSHIGGAAFQALIRMPRAHPLVAVIGTLADSANMDVVLATLEAASAAFPDPPAYAGVESAPTCRVVVRGPVRVTLTGSDRSETLEGVEQETLDEIVGWGVRSVRLEPADGSIATEIEVPASRGPVELTPELLEKLGVELPDEVLAGLGAADALEAVDTSGSRPDVGEVSPPPAAWVPPPPAAPDAWWLQELGQAAKESVASEPIDPHRRPERGRSRWLAAERKPEPEPVPDPPQPTPDPTPPSHGPERTAYLVLSSGVTVPLAGSVVLGRAPVLDGVAAAPRSAVRLAPRDSMVSRSHVRIDCVDDEVVITDLQSKNGTYVFVPGSPGITLESGESIAVKVAARPLVVLGSTASAWISTDPPSLPAGKAGE